MWNGFKKGATYEGRKGARANNEVEAAQAALDQAMKEANEAIEKEVEEALE